VQSGDVGPGSSVFVDVVAGRGSHVQPDGNRLLQAGRQPRGVAKRCRQHPAGVSAVDDDVVVPAGVVGPGDIDRPAPVVRGLTVGLVRQVDPSDVRRGHLGIAAQNARNDGERPDGDGTTPDLVTGATVVPTRPGLVAPVVARRVHRARTVSVPERGVPRPGNRVVPDLQRRRVDTPPDFDTASEVVEDSVAPERDVPGGDFDTAEPAVSQYRVVEQRHVRRRSADADPVAVVVDGRVGESAIRRIEEAHARSVGVPVDPVVPDLAVGHDDFLAAVDSDPFAVAVSHGEVVDLRSRGRREQCAPGGVGEVPGPAGSHAVEQATLGRVPQADPDVVAACRHRPEGHVPGAFDPDPLAAVCRVHVADGEVPTPRDPEPVAVVPCRDLRERRLVQFGDRHARTAVGDGGDVPDGVRSRYVEPITVVSADHGIENTAVGCRLHRDPVRRAVIVLDVLDSRVPHRDGRPVRDRDAVFVGPTDGRSADGDSLRPVLDLDPAVDIGDGARGDFALGDIVEDDRAGGVHALLALDGRVVQRHVVRVARIHHGRDCTRRVDPDRVEMGVVRTVEGDLGSQIAVRISVPDRHVTDLRPLCADGHVAPRVVGDCEPTDRHVCGGHVQARRQIVGSVDGDSTGPVADDVDGRVDDDFLLVGARADTDRVTGTRVVDCIIDPFVLGVSGGVDHQRRRVPGGGGRRDRADAGHEGTQQDQHRHGETREPATRRAITRPGRPLACVRPPSAPWVAARH